MASDPSFLDPRVKVQFRPGHQLRQWIWEFTSNVDIMPNDAVRRLVAMTLCKLSIDHYLLLDRLATAMPGSFGGRPDFDAACDRVRTALDSANRARRDLKRPALNEEEVRQFIQRTVAEIVDKRASTGRRRSTRANE